MANITRIKAKEAPEKSPKDGEAKKTAPKEKPAKVRKPKDKATKKPFILFRPFVAFGRYLRDSWRELRQVRWPSRKLTWKMVLAVLVYTVLFGALLVVFDILFDFIFSLILK
ncbi:preprotein translocase subunit SecE [Candidatus Saccharibacteria bacterium]|nr:preprotein translocase subunit SecE [Candidatus Saccharibacteria bacterium]